MDTTTLGNKAATGASGEARGDTGSGGEHEERMPAMQSLLDNPFLLLFIGVAVPTVFYLVWGIMEVAQIGILP